MDPVRGSGCGEHKLVHKQRMSLRIPLDFPSKVCAQCIVVMIIIIILPQLLGVGSGLRDVDADVDVAP